MPATLSPCEAFKRESRRVARLQRLAVRSGTKIGEETVTNLLIANLAAQSLEGATITAHSKKQESSSGADFEL